MSEVTDEYLASLITAPKTVTVQPARAWKTRGGERFRRNEAELRDREGRHYVLFMRQSLDLPEDFSIGLREHLPEVRGDVTLLRCNGRHHEDEQRRDPGHHGVYHSHTATADDVNAGNTTKPRHIVEAPYDSFLGALGYAVKRFSVEQPGTYFPQLSEGLSLFPEEEDHADTD